MISKDLRVSSACGDRDVNLRPVSTAVATVDPIAASRGSGSRIAAMNAKYSEYSVLI